MGSSLQKILANVAFIALVATFLIDRGMGWRIVGGVIVGGAVWLLWKRRIPYSYGEGQPPSGTIEGGLAVILGLAFLAFGMFLVLMPEAMNRFW